MNVDGVCLAQAGMVPGGDAAEGVPCTMVRDAERVRAIRAALKRLLKKSGV